MGLSVKFVQCHLNDDGVRGCERKSIVFTLAGSGSEDFQISEGTRAAGQLRVG